MATQAELIAWRDKLVETRARGLRSLTYEGRSVTFGADIELANAIADLDRRIAQISGTAPRVTYVNARKGT
jgi:hypothetical protein